MAWGAATTAGPSFVSTLGTRSPHGNQEVLTAPATWGIGSDADPQTRAREVPWEARVSPVIHHFLDQLAAAIDQMTQPPARALDRSGDPGCAMAEETSK
jgi:hypothetical protein